MRFIRIVFIFGFIVLAIGAIAAAFVCYHPLASRALVQSFLEKYSIAEEFSIGSQYGSLAQGLILENVVFTNVKHLPPNNILKVQRAFVTVKSLSVSGLKVEIENARLFLPESEPFVISGKLENNLLDFNLFANKVGFDEVQELIPALSRFYKIKGNFSEIDLYVKGSYRQPEVNGSVTIRKLSYNQFVLSDCPVDVEVIFKNISKKRRPEMYGQLHTQEGTLDSQKVKLDLQESGMFFDGDIKNPYLNLHGESVIDKIKITLAVKGSRQEPEIHLTSKPSLPEKQLMLMIVTGKRWKGIEETFDEGKLSADVSQDFIDYFVFGGRGSLLAEKFRLHDINIIFDKDKKGISAKKDLSDRLAIGYGLEQEKDLSGNTLSLQKWEGDYKLTEDVTFSVEKEIKGQSKSEQFEADLNADPEINDKILLKYKKNF